MGGEGIEPTRDIKPLVLQTSVSTLSRYPPLIFTFYNNYIKNFYKNQLNYFCLCPQAGEAASKDSNFQPSFHTDGYASFYTNAANVLIAVSTPSYFGFFV